MTSGGVVLSFVAGVLSILFPPAGRFGWACCWPPSGASASGRRRARHRCWRPRAAISAADLTARF